MVFGTHSLSASDAPAFSIDGRGFVWGGGGVLRVLSSKDLEEGDAVAREEAEGATRSLSPTDKRGLGSNGIELSGKLLVTVPRPSASLRLYSALYDGTRWRGIPGSNPAHHSCGARCTYGVLTTPGSHPPGSHHSWFTSTWFTPLLVHNAPGPHHMIMWYTPLLQFTPLACTY